MVKVGLGTAVELTVAWEHPLLTRWPYAAGPFGFMAAFGLGTLPTATRIAHLPPAGVLRGE